MPGNRSAPRVESHPVFPSALLAEIQRDWLVQDYGRALTRMEKHWRAAPNDPALSLHYATILGHCSRFVDARALLEELVRGAAPAKRLWALGSAGVACCEFQRFDWAADYMREAAAEPHPPAEVFYRWGESLERLNRPSEAEAAVTEGRSRFAHHSGLALLAARLARRSGAPQDAERLARHIIGSSEAPPEIRCQAGYELGHALDAQDRCAEAYAAFVAAKESQRPHAQTFERTWRARMQHLRAPEGLPASEDFRRWAHAPQAIRRPHAFLAGCPRSGTTLLERMLGTHPQLVSSSESTIWRNSVWMPLLQEFAGVTQMRAVLQAITPEQMLTARNRYWQYIAQTVEGEIGNRLLLDKNPSMFSVLAAAVRLFPEARILVARRDPRDIVWSCFTQFLPVNAATAAFVQLESTAEQVAVELGHWHQLRSRLATPWLEVSYEAIVEQTDTELRRVLSFLDLPWSADVLAFHQRSDPVRSPTYASVARPVHAQAVGSWRRYAALIEPLDAQLRAVMEEL